MAYFGDDGEQTDIRRWIANIDQANRMFGHHGSEPEVPRTILEEATDDELVEELEDDFEF